MGVGVGVGRGGAAAVQRNWGRRAEERGEQRKADKLEQSK
jgi:hypothetical protein